MSSWLIVIAVACTGCDHARDAQALGPGSALQDLSASLAPLRVAFNAHSREPRFIALLSAT